MTESRKYHTMKMVFQLAVTSAHRASELYALCHKEHFMPMLSWWVVPFTLLFMTHTLLMCQQYIGFTFSMCSTGSQSLIRVDQAWERGSLQLSIVYDGVNNGKSISKQ